MVIRAPGGFLQSRILVSCFRQSPPPSVIGNCKAWTHPGLNRVSDTQCIPLHTHRWPHTNRISSHTGRQTHTFAQICVLACTSYFRLWPPWFSCEDYSVQYKQTSYDGHTRLPKADRFCASHAKHTQGAIEPCCQIHKKKPLVFSCQILLLSMWGLGNIEKVYGKHIKQRYLIVHKIESMQCMSAKH